MSTVHLHSKKGFTLIELLVVIVIIMTLTTIGMVSYSTTNRSSRNGRRQADIAQLRSALEVYRSTVGTYPQVGNFAGLLTLIQPYLASTIVDPLNTTPYFYEYTSNASSTYQLCYFVEPSATRTCVNNP